MAHDMFLKIAGIEGESADATHSGEIDVTSWSWAVSQAANIHSGSGGGAGKATVEDFVFRHCLDRASPNLIQYCLTGKHISEATFVVRKAGEKPLEYLKLVMHDILVTRVSPSGEEGSDERPSEDVHLSFARLEHEYVVQNEQGGSAGTVTATFDIKRNTI